MATWFFKVPVIGVPAITLTRRWSGRLSVAVRGEQLPRLRERGHPFVLTMPDGTAEKIFVTKVFPDPVPHVLFRNAPIQLARPLKWWEWAIGGATFLLAVPGGTIGGAIGAAATTLNLLILRGPSRLVTKIIGVTVITLGALGSYAALILTVRHIATSPIVRMLATVPLPGAGDFRTVPQPDSDFAPLNADSVIALRSAIELAQFDSVEIALKRLEGAAFADSRAEDRWGYALTALGYSGPATESQMDAWIAARPASHLAHLVRASAYVRTGFYLRGDRTRRETRSAQFEGMGRQFDLAETQIAAALRADPGTIAGYWLLLAIAQARGDGAGAFEAFRRAIFIHPRSVRSYVQYALLLEPRWGGSLYLLSELANAADRHVKQEPRLSVVRGFTAWAESRMADSRHDSPAAVAAAQRALTFGADWHFHEALAQAQWNAGNLVTASDEFTVAETLNPVDPILHMDRSQLMYDRAAKAVSPDSAEAWLSESRREAQTAFYIDASNPSIRNWFDTLAAIKWRPR